jgi:glutamine amidotransferase
LVQEYPIKSCAVVSHIRQANRGSVALENTHPFTRELWGRYWTFAHNGQLTDYEVLDVGRFVPVGQTDNEKTFCWLLNQLEKKFPFFPEESEALFQFLATLCNELMQLGVFNMLLSDGEYLITPNCINSLHNVARN